MGRDRADASSGASGGGSSSKGEPKRKPAAAGSASRVAVSDGLADGERVAAGVKIPVKAVVYASLNIDHVNLGA